MSQTFLTLPNGQKLPALGLGTWQASNDNEVEKAIETALELGYRHIDTAWGYQNEAAIGRVINKWITSGKLTRDDLFITTKLPPAGVHPDRVEIFLRQSLEKLKLDYIDLYLIHFPVAYKCKIEGDNIIYTNEKGERETETKTDQVGVWKKMEEQVDKGRVKHIGLSNYNSTQISELLKTARIKPANLQVELHVFLQHRKLVDFCHKNGITVVAYCPLANPSYNTFLERMGKNPKPQHSIFNNAIIGKLAEKYKKTPAQIALRFLLQLGISAIPKSVTPSRIKENFNIFDFALSNEDMQIIYSLDIGEVARLADFKWHPGIENHPDFPF